MTAVIAARRGGHTCNRNSTQRRISWEVLTFFETAKSVTRDPSGKNVGGPGRKSNNKLLDLKSGDKIRKTGKPMHYSLFKEVNQNDSHLLSLSP